MHWADRSSRRATTSSGVNLSIVLAESIRSTRSRRFRAACVNLSYEAVEIFVPPDIILSGDLKFGIDFSRSLAFLMLPKIEPSATSDRKSTRLNSSHVKISYAVFCLKKKNQKTWTAT